MREYLISVCVPMYNATQYIRDCIESVLAQTFTDFELLIVDDGSTDDSCEIVGSYNDPRIRLLRNKHDYIDTLNLLLDEAKGKYIARMDADDIMCPDRLEIQYSYMENHENIDVLAGQADTFSSNINERSGNIRVKEGFICLSDLVEGCCIFHPTVMFRSASINGADKLRYRSCMKYAEDYDLWTRLLVKKKKIYNLEQVLTYYRCHEGQISAAHNNEQRQKSSAIRKWALEKQLEFENIAFNEHVDIPQTHNKLTIVIAFKNEGEEVERTINSIRGTAGYKVDIIAINDDSDDGYNYEEAIKDKGVFYVRNSYRLGAALTKERGAKLIRTPYFILLDAHMRFYDSNWANYIVEELDKNPNRLLCCKSISLHKDEQGVVTIKNKDKLPKGAFLSFEPNKFLPSIYWNYYEKCLPTCTENQVPCVLGAGYLTSKAYWNKIRGLQGLIHYGCEEAYISIKAWREGGGCYLLPNLKIGHIYRTKFPYSVYSLQYIYNQLLISESLFPTSEKMFARAVAWHLDQYTYNNAMELIALHEEQNKELFDYYKTLEKNSFAYVKMLNDVCYKAKSQSLRITDEELARAFEYILEHCSQNTDVGLFTGLSGLLIAELLYSEAGHDEVDEMLYSHWNTLEGEIESMHDLSFRNGLAGIGWALIYASSQSLIEDDIERELAIIDKKIMTMSIKRNEDYSFLDGVGGIYCYVVARLGYNKRNEVKIQTFSNDFLNEMDDMTESIQKNTDDWRTKNFVWQYAERYYADWSIQVPEFREIAELPNYIPKSKENWELSLNGIVGSIINKLIND